MSWTDDWRVAAILGALCGLMSIVLCAQRAYAGDIFPASWEQPGQPVGEWEFWADSDPQPVRFWVEDATGWQQPQPIYRMWIELPEDLEPDADIWMVAKLGERVSPESNHIRSPNFVGSGKVGNPDFVLFRAAYQAGLPRADLDCDGEVNLADFSFFRAAASH